MPPDAPLTRSAGADQQRSRSNRQNGTFMDKGSSGSAQVCSVPQPWLRCPGERSQMPPLTAFKPRKGDVMGKSIQGLCAGLAILGLAGRVWPADPPPTSSEMKPMQHAAGTQANATDEELIANAMKAAPKGVAESATIVVPDAKGGMRTLRKGTNGFTCMPDNPSTPGPDPMCWDKNAGEWIDAYLGHKTPPSGRIGFMYML